MNGTYNWKGRKVLVVEDDKESQVYYRELIRKNNAEVVIAGNGEKALKYIQEDVDINLVLLDIRLPGNDGYFVSQQIKRLRNDLPIIAQTAYAMPGEKNKSIQYGCDHFLTKPVRKEELYRVISNYLDKKFSTLNM